MRASGWVQASGRRGSSGLKGALGKGFIVGGGRLPRSTPFSMLWCVCVCVVERRSEVSGSKVGSKIVVVGM